ncbi:LacI family DNA-binding transcriptional regulator [Agrobacterium sp. NPDC090273]|uniref:LacI family DNA-binding transcriptional regulator n=1 Tax=Agrobacterium sp. NPDC090273 TaxID=3363919 RepID=UPI00383B664F
METQKERPAAAITIVDIARLAGVNPSTVSRALAGSEAVTEQTRKRIREIAQANGYVANHNARRLRSRKAGQVLVMLPNIAAFSHPQIISGIEDALEEHGIGVIVGSTKGNAERETALAEQLVTGAADGVIVLTGRIPESISASPHYRHRIIAISRPVDTADVAFVGIDDRQAAYDATRHLLSLGKSEIVHLSGPSDSPIFTARARGYTDAMTEAGLAGRVEVIHLPTFTIDAGRAAMQQLRSREAPLNAILCASDELAFGAIQVAKELGIRVPEDVAFVGFDDHPVSGAFTPPLTTVKIPRHSLGYTGAKALMQHLEDGNVSSTTEYLPHTLCIRESCGSKQ